MNTLIILVSFLLSFFFRAITTKYFLLYLSIPSLSLFTLFKKYILIALLIIFPLVLLFSSIFLVDNDLMYLDSIETFFNDYYLGNLFLLFFYFIEAFLITLIIKDANGNKIPFKITIILVSIFFLFDSVFDIVTPEIDINEDINQTIDNNISNIKMNK